MPDEWNHIGTIPPLAASELQIWRVQLAAAAGLLHACSMLLTPEERQRAERRRAGPVREQFVIGRACLRTLLGHALETPPSRVLLTPGHYGKLETPVVNGLHVSFNIAHSRNLILIALRRQGSVGIDVEYIDPATGVMEVAQSAFHKNEVSHLAAIDDLDLRRNLFYCCWTRKEAIIKADGRGLSLSLSSFEVPLSPIQDIAIPAGSADNLYTLNDIPLEAGYAGAVATNAPGPIRLLAFPLWPAQPPVG